MDGAAPALRLRIRVRGRVQGVGFRPFVHSLASAHGLGGFVANDDEGVLIEVEGEAVGAFLAGLAAGAPPLARLSAIEASACAPRGETAFRIAESRTGGAAAAIIPPDVALCSLCLDELFDPAGRRHLHPFITCTACGPRFTIARSLPYDRAATAMAAFAMCPACAGEYADPGDRRFHAEPVACPDCGPRLAMAPAEILARLRAGGIVAVKGLGGFHLAVDAANPAAVVRLRARKGRRGKPFAVMVANLESARRFAAIDAAEAEALAAPARPVVVLAGRGELPAAVSDGLPTVGLMLPYTPLHWLIFHEAAGRPAGRAWCEAAQPLALVMTSANPAGEPLVTDDAEAAERLGGIADAVAGHDRAIITRCDDSVQRVVLGAPVFLRRSRGFVPDAVALAGGGPPVLALGALLKTAPCVLRGDEAVAGQHVGDLTSAATIRFLRAAAEHLCRLLDVRPAAVACDLHPDYPSTRLAAEFGAPVTGVQHHHAHLAAVAAEYRIAGPLVGLVLDGFGLGPDGTLWGGELLRIEGTGCARLGHLAPLPLPGGDAAAREPWRMAAAALHVLGRGSEIAARFPGRPGAGVALMLAGGVPATTSAGRLFDAAAGLLGIRAENRFEGEAAMALEGLCDRPEELAGGFRIEGGVLDLSPLLGCLADCNDSARGAAQFHGTLAAGLAALVAAAAPEARQVALTGGCAVNRPLAAALASRLADQGRALLVPRAMPPGDGGIALGQAAVARALMMETG
ncbi:MAG: carbamoyltransferase HypF [Rhodobacteraceae bacterium]|jgi:hydrogenase maturation protein HypF|nr:carbamoyltransferase HypF [Paracoccaceae bacterium]